MGKPAGSLTRPLAGLIELGYVRKEVPFGESERSSKRTLYRLSDPFLSFHFRFLQPHRSLLELGIVEPVEDRLKAEFRSHVAAVWGALARQSVPFTRLHGTRWGAASRWWTTGSSGGTEFDVVAESLDGKAVLVGEAKWTDRRSDAARLAADLRARASAAPFVRGRKLHLVLWLKRPRADLRGVAVVTPDAVLDALR
jgi:hypothetical protein